MGDSYIKSIFPKSNPNAILLEVESEYELAISTWLGYDRHTKQDMANMFALIINIFEDIFKTNTGKIHILVNHWDILRDVYMLNQFDAYKNGEYISNISVDETQEEEREQFFMATTIPEINYQNVLRRFLERDYDKKNEITSRIFFIHPEKQLYLLYFDSEIIIGCNNLPELKSLFQKYHEHIGDGRRKSFMAYSKLYPPTFCKKIYDSYL